MINNDHVAHATSSFLISATIYGKRSIELISMSILGLLATYLQTIMWWRSKSTTISVSIKKHTSIPYTSCFLYFRLSFSPPRFTRTSNNTEALRAFLTRFCFSFKLWPYALSAVKGGLELCLLSFCLFHVSFLSFSCLFFSRINAHPEHYNPAISFSFSLFFYIYFVTLLLSITTCYDVWQLPGSFTGWQADCRTTGLQD